MTTDAPASWNYVALGDSLAVGTGASHAGYVDRYAAYLEDDTGAQVRVIIYLAHQTPANCCGINFVARQ